jgi:transposase-like protein
MIELVLAGRAPPELAREFSVAERSIGTWVAREVAARARRHDAEATLHPALHAELARLLDENAQLRREGEFLAKASAWFRKFPVNVDV